MPFDGTQLDETTKLLIAARERIERGWCQKKMRLGGEVCMVGAMADARANEEAWRRMARATGIANLAVLADWNDRPERTKEEVLAAFDRAIASV
jgi:hypothetical protein